MPRVIARVDDGDADAAAGQLPNSLRAPVRPDGRAGALERRERRTVDHHARHAWVGRQGREHAVVDLGDLRPPRRPSGRRDAAREMTRDVGVPLELDDDARAARQLRARGRRIGSSLSGVAATACPWRGERHGTQQRRRKGQPPAGRVRERLTSLGVAMAMS